MAIVNGFGAGWSGKVGNLIFSKQPDGRTSVSQAPQSSDIPPTIKQLAVQQETIVMGPFMSVMKEFVKMGWELQGKMEKMNQNNAMVKHLREHSFTGEGTERHFDFSKVLVTRGAKSAPSEVSLIVNEFGLLFKWNKEINSKQAHFTDQFVMLAYFPELTEVRYTTAGAQRHIGKDMLMLSGVEKGYSAEVYVAFVADDRKSISDSVYMGHVIWE